MGWIREARVFAASTLGNLGFVVRRDTASVGNAADGELAALSCDSSGNLRVTATASTGATALGKAEDVAHATGDTGVAVWAVRRDTAAVGSGTDGDYSSVNVDSGGHVWVRTREVTGPFHGQNTVAAAGTEEALAASQALTEGVWVKALFSNTDSVWVGDATVSSADGYELRPGEAVFVRTANLANVSIDADVTGEGVSYIGW